MEHLQDQILELKQQVLRLCQMVEELPQRLHQGTSTNSSLDAKEIHSDREISIEWQIRKLYNRIAELEDELLMKDALLNQRSLR
jgi:predicted RNase H-like nuclease (RuvC/YqgF family)